MHIQLISLLPLFGALTAALPVPRHLNVPDLPASSMNTDMAPSVPGVAPVGADPEVALPTPSGKMTNAQRLAQGLGPLPPTRRSHGMMPHPCLLETLVEG